MQYGTIFLHPILVTVASCDLPVAGLCFAGCQLTIKSSVYLLRAFMV
jgi:hypothetical protein